MAELSLSGLRVVARVAALGSFTAAADALGYTQSAVSRQVAAMEDAVGATLFERNPRGVRPTPVGEVLLRHAAVLLDAADAARRELTAARERLVGRLVVGAYPTGHVVLLPRALALLRDEHPAVEVTVHRGGSRSMLRMLRAHQIELAVIVDASSHDHDLTGLRYERLLTGRLRVAVPDRHRLAGLPSVTAADLRHEPWIAGTGPAGDTHLGAAPGIPEPRIAYRAEDWLARLGLVAAGLGVALVPDSVASLVSRGITVLPLDDDALLPRRVLAVTHRSTTPLADAFITTLRRVARSSAL